MKTLFVKIPACIVLFVLLGQWQNKGPAFSISGINILLIAGFSIFAVFFVPGILSGMKGRRDAKLWVREQHDAAELAHQNEMRRERERIQMRNEESVRHLFATLDIQFQFDAKKLEQLEKMKREFTGRQSEDMASVLARLQAMKASK